MLLLNHLTVKSGCRLVHVITNNICYIVPTVKVIVRKTPEIDRQTIKSF